MATVDIGPVHLHFDDEGEGYPVLLIAPGGMRSANDLWNNMPWNPRLQLAGQYRVIGMDQRNAGQSSAPVTSSDGWSTYTNDQLALLDHLGIERCHVIGMCIGGPYVVGLLRAAPQRFSSAVLLQPVGIDGNRGLLREMFDTWAAAIAPDHPEADAATWASFGDNLWPDEVFLTATAGEIAGLGTPILVAMGNDQYHPQSVSRELASLAPAATLVERWKDAEVLTDTDKAIKAFLTAHTPASNRATG